MSDRKRIALAFSAAALLAGCGQTGKLYLPEPSGEMVTRPTQTPPEGTAPADSPQTVDSPPLPGAPTPEDKEKKADKKN
jgi:predicted small lipoprotein YifL